MSKDIDVFSQVTQAEFSQDVSFILLRRATVLVTGNEIAGVFRADERLVIEKLARRRPLGLNVVSNLSEERRRTSERTSRAFTSSNFVSATL